MSKNIKEIGKELLGKSLNSFHRKTGLTKLERNNEMQDSILDGILSQVDDAYIEKTEQSNVIHLEGSGDGVVVLDSIEGDTMVNLNLENKTITRTSTETYIQYRNFNVVGKPSTVYTLFINITKNTTEGTTPFTWGVYLDGATLGDNNLCAGSVAFKNIQRGAKGVFLIKFTSRSNLGANPQIAIGMHNDWQSSYEMEIKDVILLEGDWTNKEIPSMFEGLQSSFEDKVNDEGKYEIEILSKTRNNLYDLKTVNHDWTGGTMDVIINPNDLNYHSCEPFDISHLRGKTIYAGMFREGILRNNGINFVVIFDENKTRIGERFNITSNGYLVPSNAKYMKLMQYCGGNSKFWIDKDKYVVKLEPFTNGEKLVEHKSNKIKLLINEPLRAVGSIKDRLCVKDGKLVVERWLQENIINGTEYWAKSDGMINSNTTDYANFFSSNAITNHYNEQKCLSDKFMWEHSFNLKEHNWINNSGYNICILKSKANTINEFKTWLSNNNIKVVSVLREPTYEEVLNEYGEPILLEGYENGTLYIDSTIIPTTTVKYTPKMESFKTLKEVNKNNNLITLDINENIIPYMMDVDYMIMEKELCLLNTKNIRKMEELDMTSMQKRTQNMLERLIKGKSLTEQECKTRVTTYLNAGKITDEQAEELMLLISEVYA